MMATARDRLHFRIGEISVSLRSDLEDVTDDFSTLYRTSSGESSDKFPRIQMEVRKRTGFPFGRKRYALYADGKQVGRDQRGEEVLPFLEWAINWRVIETRTEFVQIHAGTVAWSGQGFVFAGSSGAGKSTLVAGLLARGWDYLSDEFALVNPETLHIHAFPKALCIKAGSFGIIEQLKLPFCLRGHYVKALKGRVGYVKPEDVRPNAIATPCPIRFVIFPKFRGEKKPSLYPIPRAQAAFMLAEHTLNRFQYGERATPVLCNAVKGARCYFLETGHIEETCDLIESLVME